MAITEQKIEEKEMFTMNILPSVKENLDYLAKKMNKRFWVDVITDLIEKKVKYFKGKEIRTEVPELKRTR